MLKFNLICFLSVWLSIVGLAQNAPTYQDWVRPNQTYVEIKIAKTGVYRLDAGTLAPHFANIQTLNVAGFQLFRRGKEQSVFVNAGSDNFLDGSDYIEFTAFMNDAEAEVEMYQKPMPAYNKYRSLFNDTAHYFLTYTPALDGKRVENPGLNNQTSVPFETYHWRKVFYFNTNSYAPGKGLRGNATFSSYMSTGEGWSGGAYSTSTAQANTPGFTGGSSYIPLNGIVNLFAGPKIKFELLVSGRQSVRHPINLFMGVPHSIVDTFSFQGIGAYLFRNEVDQSLVQNNRLSAWPIARATANLSVSYAAASYPATFQMPNGLSSLHFELLPNPSNYSRIKFDNLAALPALYDVSDPLNPVRISVALINGAYTAGVSNTAVPRMMLVQNAPELVASVQIKKCSFTAFNPLLFDYIIVSHPALRRPSGGYSDPVSAYAEYRSSPQGGSYRVLTLMMEEVYQRFGYGDRTPLSVRNLGGFFIQNQVKPKGLFLIGKATTVNRRFTPTYGANNLIPTFGVPPSDNAFAVGLGDLDRTVSFPVGRLAATLPEHVVTYLNKVKETEDFKYDDLWKKRVYLISGGVNQLEQSSFTNLVNEGLRPRLLSKYLGSRVGTYNKSSNLTVEPVDMRNVLNEGISLLTLFGHSSRDSPDVEIGKVSNPVMGINNIGKYPMVIVNGCFSGNIYETSGSLNEDWILTPNKGAVLFLSSTDEGFSALLRRHIEIYYKKAYQDSALFGETAGKIQQEAMREYLSSLSSDPQLDSSFMHQFALHGDPLVRIFAAKKPDYKTSNGEVFIATPNANAGSPSIRIGVIASNFGRFSGDTVTIGVRRRFSDGSSNIYLFQTAPLAYKDTFYVDLPQNEGFVYSGNTRLEITLDFQNLEDELNETNNMGVIEIFLPPTGIIPLFPKNYTVVSKREVKLTVQSTDLLTNARKYIFQIDTSASFTNSGAFMQSPVILGGNICSWNAFLPFDKDSTVFFWRVRFADPVSIQDTAWYTQSFEYIKNSPNGWAQSHFYQFKQSEDNGLVKNYVERRWSFPTLSRSLDLFVSGGSRQGPLFYNFSLDGVPYLQAALSTSDCYRTGYKRLCAIHLSKCSLLPEFWNYYPPELFYLAGCGRVPTSVNIFEFSELNNGNTMKIYFQKYINEKVPVGDYVILFPVDSVPMSVVRQYAAPVLPLIGINSTALDPVENGNPFIIFGQRTELPSPGAGTLVLATDPTIPKNRQTIRLQRTVSSACASGTVTSTKIGPASKWFSLFNKMGNIELPPKDKFKLQLIGIDLSGKDSVLVETITQFPFSLDFVNAELFPFLQLKAYFDDSTYYTPATIKRWMVTYDGVPEGVINTGIFPSGTYTGKAVPEGDSLQFEYAFTNISQKAFRDSVKVQFSLNGEPVQVKNLGLLPPDSTVRFRFDRFSTLGKPDNNQLLAYVNPKLQPEEYYENNALNVAFKVNKDVTNPVLDVTFDGVKIMNGDFVSSTPVVAVVLKDENKFLIKSDTAGMVLLLTRSCTGCLAERISFTSPLVKVFPAGKDNMFRIEYRPEKLENGTYRLAVQGSDVKGNRSGSQSYEVEFKVLDQNTITNFYPYPNPFSTSCQWVFTLTGELPGDFKIQIMTVTGRVVREITKAELGPLRIGNNITSYRWDGTDEYGDRLANGVYLYRVVMKEASTFAHRATEGDHTFTKGFGKLYIIR